AHQSMARKLENLRPVELIVTGLPAKMLPADVEDLVASFGTVESVEPLQPGQMVVTFDSPAAAEKAAGGLRGECLGDQSLECHLKPRPPLDEEDVAADAAEVLVMNIHPEATAEEIEALFSPIGPAKVRWPSANQDAGSLRFCYVRFASLTQAQNAVTQLVGVTLHGQGVQLSPAKPMSDSCTVFVGKIPYEAQEADVQEALSPAGEVAGVRILRNGQKGSIAFADFTCREDAAKALDNLQGVYCLGSRLHLELEQDKKQQWLLARAPRPRGSQRSHRAQSRTKWDPSPSKLFLGNVPAEATEDDLRSIFCAIEGLIEVAIVRCKTDDTGPGYAFVRYMTAEQATMALDMFQVLELFGRQLRLRPSGKENDDWRNSRKAPPGRTLIIRHLPRSAQESELRVLFEPYGKITQVKVLHEKDFTHAQVVFKEAAHAKAAQECLQKVDFRGRSVKVVRAKSRSPERKDQQQQQRTSPRPHLFVGNLPAELDENTFRETMEGGGEVSHVKLLREKNGKFKCCAFVEYADPACVDEAIELLNNVNCLDKPMKVQRYRSPTPPGRTSSAPLRRPHLFVGNLPEELDETTFRETMEGGGEVSHVKLLREKNGKFKGCAFVEYADPASVDEAIELLNTVNCLDKPMKVQRYRSPTPPGRTRTRSRSRSPRVPYPASDPGVWRPPAVVPHYLQPSAQPPPPPMMPLQRSFLPPPRPTSAVAPSTPRSIVRPSCAAHLREGSDNDQVQFRQADRSRSRARLPPPRRRRRTAGHETQRW
ncbi:pab1, partial [Symbiodinium microadriaticum]